MDLILKLDLGLPCLVVEVVHLSIVLSHNAVCLEAHEVGQAVNLALVSFDLTACSSQLFHEILVGDSELLALDLRSLKVSASEMLSQQLQREECARAISLGH